MCESFAAIGRGNSEISWQKKQTPANKLVMFGRLVVLEVEHFKQYE